MKNFIIEINDNHAFFKEEIVFTDTDISETIEKAGKYPVTPLIVEKIAKKAKEKDCSIDTETAELFHIAKEILLEKKGTASINGRKINKNNTKTQIVSGSEPISSLNLVQYQDHLEEIEQLSTSIRNKGNIPVVWCKARGFLVNHLSRNYPLFENTSEANICDPVEAIKFIISKPQERVSYIFEDFHHYIGDKDVVNSNTGEFRSVIKDLYRNLKGRNDSVYFFVPNSYELPLELISFFNRSPKNTKMTKSRYLDRFGQLLTDPEYISHTKPLIGMNHIIERIIQILAQMETNNPLLIGSPGVGKTALIEGLAKLIQDDKVSPHLKGKKLYSLSLNSLLAGTRYRGDFEIRLEGLMQEVICQKDKIIIFIDEIHTLLDAGSSEGAIGAGDILKPILSRGEFPCIGATTPQGYKYFSKDLALLRRFKKVMVAEPDISEALLILRGISNCFEKHHRLKIDDDALRSAVHLSDKYLPDEHLPGKAISIIDGAAAFCSIRGKSTVKKEDIMIEIEKLRN